LHKRSFDYWFISEFSLLNFFPITAGFSRHIREHYMKHIFFLLAMLTIATLVFSQSGDEKAVRETVTGFQAALKNNNADSAARFLTDDYGFVGPATMMNKEQRLASMKSGQLKYESFDYKDLKLVFYGDMAVATTTAKIKLKGQDTGPVTLTLVKKGEQWKVSGECIGNSCDR